MSSTSSSPMAQLESILQVYLVDKAPFQIPAEVKEGIVKYGPWVLLIFMLFSIPALLAVFSMSAMLSPYAPEVAMRQVNYFPIILSIIALILNAIALPGLFKRSISGWRLAFYAQIVSVIASLLSGAIVSMIISGVVGFYILFQIKSYYK